MSKAVNYTPEQSVLVREQYLAGVDTATLATMLGKSVRSIVAKLSREGVYKAKEYVSKTGAKPVKKDTFADDIASVVGLTEAETESLTKANKTALQKILSRMLADSQVIAEFQAVVE